MTKSRLSGRHLVGFLCLFLLCLSSFVLSQVTLSEIMYDPAGNDNWDEFIEIFNLSETDSVDLTGWQVADSSSGDEIVAVSSGLILHPQQFGLILDADYFTNSSLYDSLLPAEAVILTIDGKTFGQRGLVKSRSLTVYLKDKTGAIVSERRYTLDETKGHSEEKIILNGDNSNNNWKKSQTLNGTPGFINSVTPQALDIALDEIQFIPSHPRADDIIFLKALLKNIGLQSIDHFRFLVFDDRDHNGMGAPGELLGAAISYTGLIAPGDTCVVSINLGRLAAGEHNILAEIELADDRAENNFLNQLLRVGFLREQVLISEFMYYPLSQDEPEWVEIYCSGPDSINLKDWSIGDNRTLVKFTEQNTFLFSGQYAVIAADSAFFDFYPSVPARVFIPVKEMPKFNNTTPDQVILSDPGLNVIDSLEYKSSWGGKNGFTLERRRLDRSAKNSTNWASSRKIGGTPGAKNSSAMPANDLSLGKKLPMLKPGKPGPAEVIQFSLWVFNNGVNHCDGFTLKLFTDINLDSIGQSDELLASFIYTSLNLASEDSLLLSGTFQGLGSGKHQILYQLQPDDNLTNNLLLSEIIVSFPAGALLINEFMYAPDSDHPEWLELYNPGSDPINIYGWQMADSSISHRITMAKGAYSIAAGEFAIVARDSSIHNSYPDHPFKFLVPRGTWPGFNNSKDAIVIYDLCGIRIDSVFYSSEMGGGANISLERLCYDRSALIKKNWRSCVHPLGATPGQPNSVIPSEYDLALVPDSISFYPDIPRSDQAVRFILTVRNEGKQTIKDFSIRIYFDLNRDSLLSDEEMLVEQVISPMHELSWLEEYSFSVDWQQSKAGLCVLGFMVFFPEDENLSNNTRFKEIAISQAEGNPVINEIMYYPQSGQVEWLELFNPADQGVNLRGFSISDASREKIRITGTDLYLPGHQFAILAAGLSEAFVEESVIVPEAGFPILNNDQDEIFIFDAAGIVTDSVHYCHRWGGRKGASLERIWWERSAVDSTNWAISCDSTGATPNRVNCASPKQVDIAFWEPSVEFSPIRPAQGQTVHFSFYIRNVGRQAITHGFLELFLDSNFDTIYANDERIGKASIDQVIEPESNFLLTIDWPDVPAGNHSLMAYLSFADDDPGDNFQYFSLFVCYDRIKLLINEIMYNPFPDRSEWIELYNPTEVAVNLNAWELSDADTSQRMKISKNLVIPTKGFVVLSDKQLEWRAFGVDSAPNEVSTHFPSLANEGDQVFLFDSMGRMVDSINYRRITLTESGYSLERVSPYIESGDLRNWAQSAARLGATPGDMNSLYTPVIPGEKKLSVSPNPFSPNGDGHEDVTIISFTLPIATSRVNLKIYDIRGRLVRFLCNNEASGARRDVPWDGKDNEGQVCRMGIYILYLEAINADAGVLESLKSSVVIAGNL